MRIKPNAVIVDMDGTLVDVSSIRHHVKTGMLPDGTYKKHKNFRAFHEEAVNCPPILETLRIVEDWRLEGAKIIIVTARSWEWASQTAWWLALNEVDTDDLFMRPLKDYRPDYEVKKDILTDLRKWYNPIHALDDNPNVLKLWDQEGIPFTRIPGWEEF